MRVRNKMRRLPVLVVLTMVLTSILSACGGAADNSNQAVTLKVMLVDYVKDKTDKWLADEIIPAFKKAHANVTVEPIYVTWGTLDETIQGYFAAGSGADIINLGSEYIGDYGDRLAPLNKYLGEQAWPDIKQYLKSTLDTVTWKGELRGLPWLTAPRAYMCRTDLAKNTTTFSDSVAEAKKATKVEGNAVKQAGLVTTGRLDDWQEFVELIWALGGQLYKADGNPTFDSAEVKAALKFMYDRRRAVYPNETVTDLPEATGSRLADGSAACVWGNLWGAPATGDALWSKIELTASPTDSAFPNSKPVVQVFNDWLAVPNYSKNVEMAAEFLKVLGSAENQNRYNKDFGSFPPRKDAWTGYVASDAVMLKMGDLMEKHGIGFADIRSSAKLREILQKEMPAYFTDVQDLDTTLKNIQTQYTQVLKDAKMVQ
ncbi:MAG TPA: extracellular solute-binding protein [Chloroflexia bacterium]|nr:extracellular solute-binding protein [Chloroflexia bacterium]